MNHEDAKRFACYPKLKNGALGKRHEMEEPCTLHDVMMVNPETYVMIAANDGSCGVYIGKCGDFIPLGAFFLDLHYQSAERTRMTNALIKAHHKNTLEPSYSGYKPLLSRQVLYYYSRRLQDEPPMWIVVIEGNEIGKFWTLKECETWLADSLKETLAPKKRPSVITVDVEDAVEQEIEAEE